MQGFGPWAFRRSQRTTQISNESLGWAEVRHPFHPLRGQRFPVLKTRRVGGTETLILRESTRGSLAVRREWTDWDAATGDLGMPPRQLALESLLELAKLVDDLRHPAPTDVDR
jgi:Family of unknown function (DUF5372)